MSKITSKAASNNYSLAWHKSVEKELAKLGIGIQRQFAEGLQKAMLDPHRKNNWLSGYPLPTYKIKVQGFRLVYEVHDDSLKILVLCAGKRERNAVYNLARQRATKKPSVKVRKKTRVYRKKK